MKDIESAARDFAATKIKDKNKQPDNDIFFAAKEGYEQGADYMEKQVFKAFCKAICPNGNRCEKTSTPYNCKRANRFRTELIKL